MIYFSVTAICYVCTVSQVDGIIKGPEMEPSANIGGSDSKYCIKS